MSTQEDLADDPVKTICGESHGFESFTLRNSRLELTVVPELGAKVISLRNLQTGREWMYFPSPGRTIFRNHFGEDFSRSPVAGWDECLPTIAPCEWLGCQLPDHGEVWSLAWKLDQHAWQQQRIQTTIRLRSSQLHFERTIALVAETVVVEYTITNLAGSPQEFLWAMHPLLALVPGDELELPSEWLPDLSTESWVHSLQFEATQPACRKIFLGPLRQGRVAVRNTRQTDRLEFTWDVKRCPFLGVWLTLGGWHKLHHLALEPANGSDDSLAIASGRNERGYLMPEERQSWRVMISLASVASQNPMDKPSHPGKVERCIGELELKP